MAQLFAAYLTQKSPPALVSGQYDPEQELWVGDNQLQGATQTTTVTHTLHQTHIGDPPQVDTIKDSDEVRDSDNP